MLMVHKKAARKTHLYIQERLHLMWILLLIAGNSIETTAHLLNIFQKISYWNHSLQTKMRSWKGLSQHLKEGLYLLT